MITNEGIWLFMLILGMWLFGYYFGLHEGKRRNKVLTNSDKCIKGKSK